MTYLTSTARERTVVETGRHFGGGLGSLMSLRAMLTVALRWRQRVQERRHLAQLDDHVLSDMGLTRLDVAREVARPFWQPLNPRSGGG